MTYTPWTERFAGLDDEVIGAGTRFTPSPLNNLSERSPGSAANLLCYTLNEIFLPTPRNLRVMRNILSAAETYSSLAYTDSKVFLSRLYKPEMDPLPAICLTGPAGGGKSALLKALNRLLGKVVPVDAGNGHQLLMRAFFYFKVEGSCNEQAILRAFIESSWNAQKSFSGAPESDDETPPKSPEKILLLAKRMACRDGIAAIILDELQFITQSSEANTLVTRALLKGTYLGPPLVFASNYDMVHRLKKRGQQDRDRLLSRPIVLLPEALARDEDAKAWQAYLEACVNVSGGGLAFDPKTHGEVLHEYTFGLRRNLLDLFRIGYGYAREQNRLSATIQDLEWAYRSGEYGTHRRDVEELVDIALGRRSSREDLRCPFEIDPDELKIRRQDQQTKNLEITSERATIASLSPDEAKAFVSAGGNVHTKPQKTRKKSSHPRPTEPATAESLMRGAQRFKEEQSKRGGPIDS